MHSRYRITGGDRAKQIQLLDEFYDNWCAHNIDEWKLDTKNQIVAFRNNDWMKFWENVVHEKQDCPINYDPMCTGVGVYDIMPAK